LVVSIFMSTFASADSMLWQDGSVYIGAECHFKSTKSKQDSLGPWHNVKLQKQVFAGIKLKENIGLEYGNQFYSYKKPGHKGGSLKSRSSSINLIGFMPTRFDELSLIGSVGVTHFRGKYHYRETIRVNNKQLVSENCHLRTRTKYVPRVMAGFQHMLNESIGMRYTAVYDLTSKLKAVNVPSRSGMSYGIGLFSHF